MSAKEEFFTEFYNKTGFMPEEIELVSVEGSEKSLSLLQLEYPPFQKQLWGLLVFCEKNLFFYSQPQEFALLGIFKPNGKELSVKEQLVDFSMFDDVKASLPVFKNRLTAFFSRNRRAFELKFSSAGEDAVLLVQPINSPSSVAEKVNQCILCF